MRNMREATRRNSGVGRRSTRTSARHGSGVKRAGASQVGQKGKRPVHRRKLYAQSRYRDTRCVLRGSVLSVESVGLSGTIQLPARINTDAPALRLLTVEDDVKDYGVLYRLTHPVLKHVLGPWLEPCDLAALSKAVTDVPFIITLSMQGVAVHECTAMQQRCHCTAFKCPQHYVWNQLSGGTCVCMKHKQTSRDAEATSFSFSCPTPRPKRMCRGCGDTRVIYSFRTPCA